MFHYECDQCGACCQGQLIVEVEELDILREPRLIDADLHHQGKSVEKMLDDYADGMAVILACGNPCPFLTENRCSIYPTRPNCCVGLQAGDEQCQQAREAAGLLPLPPVGFPMEDAVAMGLTPEAIRQAIAEGVTSTLGLQRMENRSQDT